MFPPVPYVCYVLRVLLEQAFIKSSSHADVVREEKQANAWVSCDLKHGLLNCFF